MRTPLIDDRTFEDKRLRDIEFGGAFSYNEIYFRRVSIDMAAFGDNTIVNHIPEDQILVEYLATGDLTCLNRDTWVAPVSCEIHLVD